MLSRGKDTRSSCGKHMASSWGAMQACCLGCELTFLASTLSACQVLEVVSKEPKLLWMQDAQDKVGGLPFFVSLSRSS